EQRSRRWCGWRRSGRFERIGRWWRPGRRDERRWAGRLDERRWAGRSRRDEREQWFGRFWRNIFVLRLRRRQTREDQLRRRRLQRQRRQRVHRPDELFRHADERRRLRF